MHRCGICRYVLLYIVENISLILSVLVVLYSLYILFFFFFSSRRRHTRYWRDWSSDVCSSDLDLQDPLRRDFIAPEQFAKLQDTLGITPDTTVILYGGNNNWFAAYAYWYYKVYGHGPVKLLDGGRKAWELEGRELTTDPAEVPSTSGYPVREPDTSIRAFRDQVLEAVRTGEGAALVDVR